MTRSKNSIDGKGECEDGKSGAGKVVKERHGPPLPHALEQCITLDMVQNVVNTIYVMALQGHMPAARLFLQYAVGKPAKMQDGSESEAHEREAVEQTVATPVVAPRASAAGEQTEGMAVAVEPTDQTPPASGKQTVACEEKSATKAGEQTVRTTSPQVASRVEMRRANDNEGIAAGSSGAPSDFVPLRVG